MNNIAKNYNSSFLYSKANYGQTIFQYIVKSERIDKSHPGFDNIRYFVKRNQTSSCLASLLDRKSVELLLPERPMSRAFKVVSAKDVRESDKSLKVFIDVSGIIKFVNDEYVIKNSDVEILISYLACALNTLLYYTDPNIILNNSSLMNSSTEAFAKLGANIIDYMRIGGIDNIRPKMMYLCAIYFQVGILLKDATDSVESRALKISGLSQREADNLRVQVVDEDFESIDKFVAALSKVLREESLKLDNFIDKWLFLYGAGTQFATELYPAFANILINAYVGAYLVRKQQIEKIASRSMLEFCSTLFKVGGNLL